MFSKTLAWVSLVLVLPVQSIKALASDRVGTSEKVSRTEANAEQQDAVVMANLVQNIQPTFTELHPDLGDHSFSHS